MAFPFLFTLTSTFSSFCFGQTSRVVTGEEVSSPPPPPPPRFLPYNFCRAYKDRVRSAIPPLLVDFSSRGPMSLRREHCLFFKPPEQKRSPDTRTHSWGPQLYKNKYKTKIKKQNKTKQNKTNKTRQKISLRSLFRRCLRPRNKPPRHVREKNILSQKKTVRYLYRGTCKTCSVHHVAFVWCIPKPWAYPSDSRPFGFTPKDFFFCFFFLGGGGVDV